MRAVGQIREEIKVGKARAQTVVDAMVSFADGLIDSQLGYYLDLNQSPFRNVAEQFEQMRGNANTFTLSPASAKLKDPEVLAHAFQGIGFDLGKFYEYAEAHGLEGVNLQDVRNSFTAPSPYQKFDPHDLIARMKAGVEAKLTGHDKPEDRYELLAWIEGPTSQHFIVFHSPAYADAVKRGEV